MLQKTISTKISSIKMIKFEPENEDDLLRELMQGFWDGLKMFAAVAIIMTLLCWLSSCKTRTIVVETVRTDTTYIAKHQRDSIWLHDSIHVTERQSGDTIYMLRDRWHTKYIETTTRDTIIQATHDTIPMPYPVTEYVERQLTWWQKMRMDFGTIVIAALLILIIWKCIKLWRTLRPSL